MLEPLGRLVVYSQKARVNLVYADRSTVAADAP
jgi:hypothetical protein